MHKQCITILSTTSKTNSIIKIVMVTLLINIYWNNRVIINRIILQFRERRIYRCWLAQKLATMGKILTSSKSIMRTTLNSYSHLAALLRSGRKMATSLTLLLVCLWMLVLWFARSLLQSPTLATTGPTASPPYNTLNHTTKIIILLKNHQHLKRDSLQEYKVST